MIIYKYISLVIICAIITLIATVSSFALDQRYNLQIVSKVKYTNIEYSNDKLWFGINTLATTSLDTALGELEAPPFSPPEGEGVNAGFLIFDTTQQAKIWTYTDLRPIPSDGDTVLYKLIVLRGSGTELDISWYPLGDAIESAILTDSITNGNLVKVDMKMNQTVVIDNEYLDEYFLRIKYNTKSGVNDESSIGSGTNPIELFPNPSNGILNIKSFIEIINVRITDQLGKLVLNKIINSQTASLDVSALASGLYSVTVTSKGNKTIQRYIIIQN